MELKWLKGIPHDYGVKNGSTVYIIAKRHNEIHFFRTRYYYFPIYKTQEDRNLFTDTGYGSALDDFKISEVLCFLPIPKKEILISDAVKSFPELNSVIKQEKEEILVTEPHDYRFDLDYDA